MKSALPIRSMSPENTPDPPPPERAQRRFMKLLAHPALLGLLLVLITFIVFWPVAHCDFVNYDDPEYVTANGHVQEGLTWQNVAWAFRLDQGDYWHPLTWVSHMLDCQLFGLRPAGHHLSNLLLHAANTVLLFWLLRRLTGAQWRSAFVAALFALHPLHVESVAWVTERKDVLSTLFGLLALFFYARYTGKEEGRMQNEETGANRHGSPLVTRHASLSYSLALFFFACGLMSKAMVVTVPFVMLLLDWWPLGRVTRDKWQVAGKQDGATGMKLRSWSWLVIEKVPFFVLAAISSALTVWGQQRVRAVISLSDLPISNRIEHAFVAYAGYLGKAFWPVRLAVPYPLGPMDLPWDQLMRAVVLVVGLCVVALWMARRRPYLFVGWFWFWGTLIPVIGLVRVGEQSVADRFTYVPLIGVFIIVAWGAGEVWMKWRMGKVWVGLGAVLAVMICGVLTRQQVAHWRDSESLFRHTLAVTHDNEIAHHILGLALLKKGELADAEAHLREALRIVPTYSDALNSLGELLKREGKIAEAEARIREALEINPRRYRTLDNLGQVLASRGQYAEAITCFEAALQITSDRAEIYYHYGSTLAQMGEVDRAMDCYRKALQLNPNATESLNNLAWVLATDGDPNRRNGAEAVQLSGRAARLTEFKNPSILDTLAAAYAETGDFAKAAATAQKALDLAEAAGDEKLAEGLRTRLEAYKSRQPHRE